MVQSSAKSFVSGVKMNVVHPFSSADVITSLLLVHTHTDFDAFSLTPSLPLATRSAETAEIDLEKKAFVLLDGMNVLDETGKLPLWCKLNVRSWSSGLAALGHDSCE
jgi:hypothetical protein